MDSKTVKLNFLTLGELENLPIFKKKWSVPLNILNICKYYTELIQSLLSDIKTHLGIIS